MKKMSKLLSVIVALMVCVGMVAPALALDIDQSYIDGLTAQERNGNTYVEIETDDGTVNMKGDIKTEHTLSFKNQDDVVLNMNGHTLEHEGNGSVIYSEDTNLTINGKGENGERGVITGGNTENGSGTDSFGGAYGGGILSHGGDLTVNDVELTGNSAGLGGSAIHATGDGYWDMTEFRGTANVELNNVYIHDNATSNATRMPDDGAVSIERSNVTITNSTISDNITGGAGGGLSIRQAENVLIENSVISGNKSGVDQEYTVGSGMLVELSTNVKIQNTEFSNNTAETTVPNSNGGGADFNGVDNLTIEDSKFIDNSANNGGGMIVRNSYGDGYEAKPATVTIKNTEFSGNSASSRGGAIFISNVKSIEMDNVTINNNTAGSGGGGMYVGNVSSVNMTNTQVTNNTVSDRWGGGMYINSGINTTITGTNTVIAGNRYWCLSGDNYYNDIVAYANSSNSVSLKFGPVTYGDKVFDGWNQSDDLWQFKAENREGFEANNSGEFANLYENGSYGLMTFRWTTPVDPGQPGPGPNPNPNPDPVNPTPNPDPEDPVEIEDPETPLGELPDDPVEIEEPEVPLGELPEIEIDEPDVPLGDVPQTGEASTMMFVVVLLACGMGLVYVNTGKRKENA